MKKKTILLASVGVLAMLLLLALVVLLRVIPLGGDVHEFSELDKTAEELCSNVNFSVSFISYVESDDEIILEIENKQDRPVDGFSLQFNVWGPDERAWEYPMRTSKVPEAIVSNLSNFSANEKRKVAVPRSGPFISGSGRRTLEEGDAIHIFPIFLVEYYLAPSGDQLQSDYVACLPQRQTIVLTQKDFIQ